MNRDELTKLLRRAVRDGTLTQSQSDEILRAHDSGDLDVSTLPREVRDGLAGKGNLVASAVTAAVLIFLTRARQSGGSWTYDPATRRYITPRAVTVPAGATTAMKPVVVAAGKPLTPEHVRSVVDHVIDTLEPEMARTGAKLTAQRINLAEWYQQVEDQLAVRYVAMAAVARGGIGQLTDADRLWIRDQLVSVYEALDVFADDIAAGRYGIPPQGGQYEQRLLQYARSARRTYENMRGRVGVAAGLDFEQWYLGHADHCRTKTRMGCVERAAKFRQPINSLPGQGMATCLDNCHCYRRLFKTREGRAVA